MNFSYDRWTDSPTLVLHDSPVAETDGVGAGIVLDYDGEGHIVSIEVLDASNRVQDPATITPSAVG